VGVCLNKAMLDDDHVACQRQRVLDAAALLSQRLGGVAAAGSPNHLPSTAPAAAP
jgi:hypothetical protein